MVGILDDGATQRRNDKGENVPTKRSKGCKVMIGVIIVLLKIYYLPILNGYCEFYCDDCSVIYTYIDGKPILPFPSSFLDQHFAALVKR